MKKDRIMEPGHVVVTDETKVAATQPVTDELKETETVKSEEVETKKAEETVKEEVKPVSIFTLTGAGSYLYMGVKFIKGIKSPVEDETLAERLRKTGFFKEGE